MRIMAHIWYTMNVGSHEAPGRKQPMPRRPLNPHPVGSPEFLAEEDRRAQETPTERRITITVSVDAIAAAKSLATLSGMHYRDVLGRAATQGVEALTTSVKAVLLDGAKDDIPF